MLVTFLFLVYLLFVIPIIVVPRLDGIALFLLKLSLGIKRSITIPVVHYSEGNCKEPFWVRYKPYILDISKT